MIRSLATALAVLLGAVALAACGEKEEPSGAAAPEQRQLRLLLDYFPNADHAGIYAAQGTGALAQAGIDLRLQEPSDPAAVLKLLAAGKADLAISYEPEVLLARDKGLDIVAVGALVQVPLTSVMALGSEKIEDVGDLRGKKVGTAGIPYQSAYLRTILQHAGVDPSSVEEVNVGFNLVPAMLSKKVDATLGAFWNYEGTDLRRRKKDPTIIRLEQVGVPTYDELVLVARADFLRDNGPVVRRLMQALRRGHEAVRQDPATGVDPLLEANPDLERGLQTAVVRQTAELFFPEERGRPFGWQDPVAWERFGRWMLDNDLIGRPADPTAMTNEFLPGGGI